MLVAPERLAYFLAAPPDVPPGRGRWPRSCDCTASRRGEPDALLERTWGVDPFTQGYIAQWAPGDLTAVGPLHGTHEPPFYVCGSDHWVAGYMEGAVRTGRAAAAAALGAADHVRALSCRESGGRGALGNAPIRARTAAIGSAMRTLPLALAALGCALALPAAANAAYDLGVHPDGVLEGTSTTCATGCTIVQDWNANEQLRVPGWLADQSVVVRWRVRGGGGQARLQRVALDGARTASALAATDARPAHRRAAGASGGAAGPRRRRDRPRAHARARTWTRSISASASRR